jgi:hypothetical protein
MIKVRFMSLVGKFTTVKTEEFADTSEALKAVEVYAKASGFSNVRLIDDGDFDQLRFTATTPGGRGGRNVAFADDDCDYLA